jgi:hypothetical protein
VLLQPLKQLQSCPSPSLPPQSGSAPAGRLELHLCRCSPGSAHPELGTTVPYPQLPTATPDQLTVPPPPRSLHPLPHTSIQPLVHRSPSPCPLAETGAEPVSHLVFIKSPRHHWLLARSSSRGIHPSLGSKNASGQQKESAEQAATSGGRGWSIRTTLDCALQVCPNPPRPTLLCA